MGFTLMKILREIQYGNGNPRELWTFKIGSQNGREENPCLRDFWNKWLFSVCCIMWCLCYRTEVWVSQSGLRFCASLSAAFVREAELPEQKQENLGGRKPFHCSSLCVCAKFGFNWCSIRELFVWKDFPGDLLLGSVTTCISQVTWTLLFSHVLWWLEFPHLRDSSERRCDVSDVRFYTMNLWWLSKS